MLRPCFVYGPGDRHFTPTAASILRGSWFPLVDGGRAPLDVVHVDDVAHAHLLAATVPHAAGRTYNVTDGARRSMRDLVEIGARAMGVAVRTIPIPYWSCELAAALRVIARLLRTPGRDLLTGDNLRAMAAPPPLQHRAPAPNSDTNLPTQPKKCCRRCCARTSRRASQTAEVRLAQDEGSHRRAARSAGWGARIRTWVPGSKVRCPTAGRPPSTRGLY